MIYVAYGIRIESDLDLGVPAGSGSPDVTVREADGPVLTGRISWHERSAKQDDPWTAGRVDRGLFLQFEDEADMVISSDGSSVLWFSDRGRSSTLVHLVLDHALPQALMRLGRVVLHGSAVVSPGGVCLVIVGDSGWGKSTLAAALLGRGYQFLADDCAVVEIGQLDQVDGESLTVAAGYPGLRLFDDSVAVTDVQDVEASGEVSRGSTKRRFALGRGHPWSHSARHRLDVVLVVRPVESERDGLANAVQLGPARGLLALLRHSFHFANVDEREDVLTRLAAVAANCRIVALPYHHSAVGLERAIRSIEATIRDRGPDDEIVT